MSIICLNLHRMEIQVENCFQFFCLELGRKSIYLIMLLIQYFHSFEIVRCKERMKKIN